MEVAESVMDRRWLRRFVASGIVCDSQRKRLKLLGWIAYKHRTWSLTETGKTEAGKL